MNYEKYGEVGGCPMEPPPTALPTTEQATPDLSAADVEAAQQDPDASAWRDELSARLNRYRARRKAPPPRYPSLRLPFDAIGSQAKPFEDSPTPVFETTSHQALALDTLQPDTVTEEIAVPPPPEIPTETALPVNRRPAPHASAKIIEFPRFAWGPPSPPPDQLAEPVMERPRILDVPEVEVPPPALGGITIEPAPAAEVEKIPGIDIPLQSARLSLRLVASFVDGTIVAAATALFGFIFWKVTAIQPPRMQIAGFLAGTLCAFWVAYQYVLIVYGGTTPGLRIARLRLSRFDGTAAGRSLRRWRVIASCLSAVSLGMGYAWVFLDEDALCWHDRITHTYLAPVNSAKKP
jgi:hypothetical protein